MKYEKIQVDDTYFYGLVIDETIIVKVDSRDDSIIIQDYSKKPAKEYVYYTHDINEVQKHTLLDEIVKILNKEYNLKIKIKFPRIKKPSNIKTIRDLAFNSKGKLKSIKDYSVDYYNKTIINKKTNKIEYKFEQSKESNYIISRLKILDAKDKVLYEEEYNILTNKLNILENKIKNDPVFNLLDFIGI